MKKDVLKLFRYFSMVEKKSLLLLFVGSTLLSIMTLLSYFSPLLFNDLIDFIIMYRKIPIKILSLIITLHIINLLSIYFGGLIYSKNLVNAQISMRDKIYSYLFNFPLLKINSHGPTYYARLINEDVSNSFQLFYANVIESLLSVIRLIPILVTVFIWDKFIFILFLITIFLFYLFNKNVNKSIKSIFSKINHELGNILNYINETLQNLLSIKVFNYQDKRIRKYRHLANKISTLNKQLETRKIVNRFVYLDFPLTIINIIIIIYAIHLISIDRISVGRFWAILSYYAMLRNPIENLKYLSEILVSTNVYADRIMNFIAESTSQQNITLLTANTENVSLKFCEITKKYDKVIFNNLNFSINEGDIVGLIGISGEGKSSLIKMLFNLDNTYQGEILINGLPSTEMNTNDISKLIQYFPQEIEIFNTTIKENIILGADFDKTQYSELIKNIGFIDNKDRCIGKDGVFISGGEKSKIALARFIYHVGQKKLFVLDEPLVGLDSISKNEALEKIKNRINKKTGLIISHDLWILKELANRIVVLENGKVIASGTYDKLVKTNKLLHKLDKNFFNKHQNKYWKSLEN